MHPTDCACGFSTTSFRAQRAHACQSRPITQQRDGKFRMGRMGRDALEALLADLRSKGINVETVEENGTVTVRQCDPPNP